MLIAYTLLCIVSGAWSPVPVETAFQGSLLLASALGTAYFYSVPSDEIARRVVWAGVIFAILSFLAILVVPSLAFQPSSSTVGDELRGVFFHQQRLGLFMAVALGLLVIAGFNHHLTKDGANRFALKHWGWFALLAAALFASAARSYTVFMVISLTITLLLGRPGQLRFLSAVLIAIGLLTLFLARDQVFMLLAESDVDLTLTGRTMVWDRTLDLALQRPWQGWGFASFTADYFNPVWNLYRPPHAHNSYLQAFFDTGLIGLALMLVFIVLAALVGTTYARITKKYSYSLYLVIITTLCSTTGNFFGGKITFIYCLTVMLVISETHQIVLGRRRKAARTGGKAK